MENYLLPKVELQLEDTLDQVCCQEEKMVGSVSDDQLRKNAFELLKVDVDNREEWKSVRWQCVKKR